jgi:pyrimidine operon attenuation protein/uracil phosphoribosyltransferase
MGRQLSEDDIVDIASSEGIPGYQLLAIANKENSNDESVSGAGARGRFQLLPATFQSVYPEGDINNPRDNAIASARYLKQGIDANGGDFTKGAMYYYAGPSFSKKIEKAPGAKYGTNPDGTGGISIEDYGNQATRNANKYAGNNQTVTDADGDNDVSQPDADGDDLNSQIAKLSLAANTQLDKMQGSSTALSERLKANIQKQMDAVTQGGDLESTIFLDKYKQTTTQAAETATELSRLSINESDLDSTIAQISVGLNERYREAQQLRQQIRDKQSVGILDDPVGWLTNKLTINSDIRKHNAIIEDMNAQKEYVDQATSIADRAHAVNAAKFVAISNEGAQASAQLLRNKAQIEAVKLEDTMLKTDFETQARTLSLLGTRISLLDRLENSQDRQKVRQSSSGT